MYMDKALDAPAGGSAERGGLEIAELNPVSESDTLAIRAFVAKRFEQLHVQRDPEHMRDLDEIKKMYLDEGGSVLVARQGGAIVGVALLRRRADKSGELKRFLVDEAHRIDGVGQRLLKGVLETAAKKGMHSIRIDTRECGDTEIRLLKDSRFTETSDESEPSVLAKAL